MKRLSDTLSGVTLALTYLALLGWMLCIFGPAQGYAVRFSPLPPLLALIAVCGVGRIALERGVALPAFLLLETLLTAGGVAALQYGLVLEPQSVGTRITLGVFYVLMAAFCANAAWSGVRLETLTLCFDGMVVFSVLLLLIDQAIALPMKRTALALCLSAMLVSLCALVAARTEKNAARGSRAGQLLPVLLISLLAAAGILIAVFASSGAQSLSAFLLDIVRAALGAAKAVLLFAYHMIERFCLWLSQFFDPASQTPVPIDPMEAPEFPEDMEPATVSPVLFYAVAALALGGLGYLVFRLRKLRLHRAPRVWKSRPAERRSGWQGALRKLLSALASRIRYRFDCVRFRRTAAGLLDWCERHVPRSMRRRPDESGARFLLRLAAERDGEEADALRELAELVERSFYSRERPEASRALCRAIRRCRFDP